MLNKVITVIITAYKAEKFIFEAIDSILKQKLPNEWQLDLIVGIDNCPSTLAVLQKRKTRKFSVYMMKKNMGTYITFNTMMQFARGDIISRFDADDVMNKGTLNRSIEEILKGADMIMYKCDLVSKGKTSIPHGILTFTKNTWDQVGGFQSWRCGADSNFMHMVRANKSLKVIELDDKIYVNVYRRDSNSLTTNPKTGAGTVYRNMIQRQIRKDGYKFYNRKYKVVPLIGECKKYE